MFTESSSCLEYEGRVHMCTHLLIFNDRGCALNGRNMSVLAHRELLGKEQTARNLRASRLALHLFSLFYLLYYFVEATIPTC